MAGLRPAAAACRGIWRRADLGLRKPACPLDGIGRHTRLKILSPLGVPVRVRQGAPGGMRPRAPPSSKNYKLAGTKQVGDTTLSLTGTSRNLALPTPVLANRRL